MRDPYFDLPGLTQSGMKDLAVSPLRYWHLHLNPNRPEPRTSPEMEFGTAVHCAVLEPDKFPARYCKAFDPGDHPGCLRTMADLQAWLSERDFSKTGKTKAELISRIHGIDPKVPIADELEAVYATETLGKTQLSADFWQRVQGASGALLNEPSLRAILAEGQPEVTMTATDPKTGVLLKARMDWVAPGLILDLKTFSQQRGKSIDKSVTDAIWYERYLRQAYFYSYIRSLQTGADRVPMKDARFVLAFVESDEPYDVRIRELLPSFGEVNMYWEIARHEVNELIALYAECVEKYGEGPWRPSAEITPLVDEDVPQVAWA